MDHGRLKRLLEFFVIGIVFGVTEDILAVLIATDAELSTDIVIVVVLIAIPFAILSELIVDHPKFLHFDRLSMLIRSSIFGNDGSHTEHAPGDITKESTPWRNHHYYCNICSQEFETGVLLGEHLDRNHPEEQLHWWIQSHGSA
ncbi:hypothetical protein OB905_01960 [Halobacteria archaeon AArc-dxtr1]|nr:hypothetical protein [Halobacteria archaeon AArc-dxtr1]